MSATFISASAAATFTGSQTGSYAGASLDFLPSVQMALSYTLGGGDNQAQLVGYLGGTATTTPATVDLTTAEVPAGGASQLNAEFEQLRFLLIRNLSTTIGLSLKTAGGGADIALLASSPWTGFSGVGSTTWMTIQPSGFAMWFTPYTTAAWDMATGSQFNLFTASSTAAYEIWVYGNIAG